MVVQFSDFGSRDVDTGRWVLEMRTSVHWIYNKRVYVEGRLFEQDRCFRPQPKCGLVTALVV